MCLSGQQSAGQLTCIAVMHVNISMWLDGKFVYPVQVPGEIPVRVPGY